MGCKNNNFSNCCGSYQKQYCNKEKEEYICKCFKKEEEKPCCQNSCGSMQNNCNIGFNKWY